jgi:hypothetical protein
MIGLAANNHDECWHEGTVLAKIKLKVTCERFGCCGVEGCLFGLAPRNAYGCSILGARAVTLSGHGIGH